MPPLHRPGWRSVLPGVGILAGLVALALAIVVLAQPGALRGRTIRLYVTTSDASGVMKGTEVWLAGQKVGRVLSVRLRPPGAPIEERILLETEVLARYRDAVRRDSRVDVRAGGSFLGAPVVQISAGTPRAAVVADGDTVHAARSDLEGLASRAAIGTRELPLVMQNVQLLGEAVRGAKGTLGAITTDGAPRIEETRARAGAVVGKVKNGQGTLGLALGGRGALMGRARSAMARADSVMSLLSSSRGNVGRFRRDSTLLREVAAIRDELATIDRLMASPDGTMGRLQQDAAIQEGIASARQEMTALFADLKAHPFRYINF